MVKKRFYFFLILLISFSAFSLSSNYSKLLEIYKKNNQLNKNDINYLYNIYNLDKSEKWFAGYILYKNASGLYKKEKMLNFPQLFYKLSFIKDDHLLLEYLQYLIEKNRMEETYSVIQNEKRYYFEELKNLILKNYNKFIKYYTKNEINELLLSMGYYKEVIKLNPITDLYIQSLYGIRDYKKCIDIYNKNTTKKYKDETFYYISRSFAALGNYKKAVAVLSKADVDKRSLYRYYINYYKIKSEIKLEFSDLKKYINHSYYYGKLIYQSMIKGYIDDIKSIYKSLHDTNFIKAKIWFKYKSLLNDEGVKFTDSPYFNIKSNLFKGNRKIKKHVNIFNPDNKVVHEIVQINPDFVYNDLLLTGFNDKIEKCYLYYKNYLPYYGLKASFRINTKDKEYLRYPLGYIKEVRKVSKITKIDPLLILSIMREESSFKWEVSERGATGLMQIMPGTSKWLKNKYQLKNTDNKLFDHILEGSYYLKYLMNKYNKTENPVIYTIMAYNAGQGNVDKWINKHKDIDKVLLNIPFFETERYLYKVYRSYKNYIKIYG